jgi:acid phosphatase type 7
LRHELRRHRRRCQLAYWHAPLFNSGNAGAATAMARMWHDLYRARVDVVLNGHDHHYERFAPQDAQGRARRRGPREFVVGTGGRSHALPPGFVAANSVVRDYATFGVLKLSLGPRGYRWRFVHERGGRFTDRGHARCH